MPTVTKSIDQAAERITRDGHSWSDGLGIAAGPITFAFRASGAGTDNEATFSRFSADQIAAAEQALTLWSDVANVTFVRTFGTDNSPTYSDKAAILFANYNADDSRGAYAYYPFTSSDAGDVWVNQYYAYNSNVSLGSSGFKTLLHEIGHTLGLQHPGDYNAAPGVLITYDGNAEYIEDTRQFTVMSYFQAVETGADHVDGSTPIYGSTPLLHDIAAIQRLYGVNMTTRTGDTVYGFNSNADRESFHIDAASEKVVFAVWDAGGEDTFDFSGYAEEQWIRLEAGDFSDVGGLTKNIAIAQGAIVENAKGGTGDDHIFGNAAANHLYGNSGDDHLSGGRDDDILEGGDGDDTLTGGIGADVMRGGLGNDIFYVDESGDQVSDFVGVYQDGLGGPGPISNLNAGIDTVRTSLSSYSLGEFMENLTALRWENFTGNGNQLGNVVTGHDGADTLKGFAGMDTLIGGRGRDVLYGGTEADVFQLKSLSDTGTTASTRDRIADFTRGLDHIDLSAIDARSNVSGDNAFSFIGAKAFGGVSGQLHYVSTTVGRTSSTIIEGDINGDRLADFQIELSGRYSLVAGDFVL